MNVTEIEKQTRATEDKIAELDKRLEELPDIKDNLIAQYTEEKEERLKINRHKDHIKERADENKNLYNALLGDNSMDNMNVKDSSEIVFLTVDINSNNEKGITRKR